MPAYSRWFQPLLRTLNSAQFHNTERQGISDFMQAIIFTTVIEEKKKEEKREKG